ncbi:right-handed parallel beta-helix repeat-containing protein [Draconibacterium sp. IB214405]|uniref:right-handed parallel beta-helix repeat-containing protein n=1 Tax=Draconibacterium sp. IB214405 TaxID=3097352 RepID=UPI002A1505A8|nr:right-handed parallel beta-helix repeat-containing protein [Draconibacterium sp. IB214405]MDX8340487.1 right-handed parallel beta-helix repeat-containing protein [Draconibacterium sp. IB214405]
MKPGFLIILFSLLFILPVQSSASEVPNDTTYIFLKDYGLYKTRKKNATKYFYKALEDLKTDQPKVLVFSTGTYHFYPDGCIIKDYSEGNTTNKNPKVCAFHFENIKNLVIDGRGSRLIFHQEMQPFTFDNCQNITLKNLIIDWEQPFVAQVEILRVTDHYIDIGLDPKESPYRLVEGKIFFDVGNGNSNEWNGTLEFDRKGRFIVPQTGENPCLGKDWDLYHAEPTMPGIVRLHFEFQRKPQIGNYLVMTHSVSSQAGVFIHQSEHTEINNLRIFHSAGPGIIANRCNDLTIDRYQAIPNRSNNRYFSGLSNGLQLANCKGDIEIKNCTFQGLMGDAIVSGNSTFKSNGELNDINTNSELLTIANNNFNSCRGSGIVLTTAGTVEIKNNTFETSGSAVLITAEPKNSHQTEAIKEVTIANNTFKAYCNSSTYNLCEAVISVFPTIPEINEKSLPYNKNISIVSNQFNPFDFPLIYALSVNGLVFNNNTITENLEFEPFHDRQYNFSFDYCRNITVTGNIFSDDVRGKNMLLKKTSPDQLKTDLAETFSIERY